MSDINDTTNEEMEPEYDRPPHNKVRLTFIVVLWLVIVLLLIAIFSPVRDVVIKRYLTAAPTPTPTIVAGGNQFYIDAYPQGTVTIDGHAATYLPNENNNDIPITLSRGRHKIMWQAPPFQPLSCIVFVPPLPSEPCNYESLGGTPNAPGARIISFTASMTNLSNAQQTELKQAIQATLNTLQSTDTLQAGEQYVNAQPAGEPVVKTAAQPLNATLRLHLDANPTSSNSCTPNGDFCTLSGQNCIQICSDGETASPNGAFTWNIIALYYSTWTYTTQGGQVVARDQPDTNYPIVGVDHSIDLSATWDGKVWKVNLPRYKNALFPSTTNLQFNNAGSPTLNMPPPACASINNFINSTNFFTGATPFSVTQGSNPTTVNWGFVVGTNEAQGCLGVVVPNSGQQTPTNFKQPAAYFLYRCGVLLAVNTLAHSDFPSVPLADAYEQGIAQQLEATYKV